MRLQELANKILEDSRLWDYKVRSGILQLDDDVADCSFLMIKDKNGEAIICDYTLDGYMEIKNERY